MINRWRRVPGVAAALCAVLLFTSSVQVQEPERELEAGKHAADKGNYADAVAHLNKANQLQQDKCSECYVWLARIDMAKGNLKGASEQAEKALATASNDGQRSSAQLYRGIVLGCQGNLAQAEVAFKAASALNPPCVECRFNLGFVLLKQSKDAEGVAVLKAVAPAFAGTPRGREIQKFIDDPSRIRKNYAPEFSAKLSTGEEINLDTLK